MRQRDKKAPQSAEETVREIRRATGRPFSVKEKIRLMLVGLRSEVPIAELCRREGIAESLLYEKTAVKDYFIAKLLFLSSVPA